MLRRLDPPPQPEHREAPVPRFPATPAPSVAVHTSERAADAQTRAKRRRAWETILEALAMYAGGLTADAIELHTSLKGNTVRPRLQELRLAGLTCTTRWERLTRTGQMAYVEQITDKGRQLLRLPPEQRKLR